VNATKERQAWCCLQVKLQCDPCLSALCVHWCKKALYKYSSFPSFPFTETVVLRVLSDILLAADRGDVSALVLLDMTVAFDTVNHSILLQRLQSTFGICDIARRRFQSYLSGREQRVRRGSAR